MSRILVIDDDRDIRNALTRMLTAVGHDVITAPDGKQALRRFAGDPTDLVITDIFMPEMDGLDLLTRLRETFPETPVIIISGGGALKAEGLLKSAKAVGAVSALAKPFEMDDLLEMVSDALGEGPSA